MTHEINPQVVHLELHTSDRAASTRFYSGLLRWQTQEINTLWGSYHALRLGSGFDGGIVECRTPLASWLPYVAVDQIEATTELARRLGAQVLLAPRAGPAGWRAVLSTPAGGQIALWQPRSQTVKVA
jgi:predicted enzyme related to lactoylglutathione lyase